MPNVEWSPQADAELEEIATYIGIEKQNPQAADRLLAQMCAKAEAYARQPGMGTLHEEFPRDEIAGSVRSFHVKHWIAFYLQTPAGIYVLRVIDGRRDYGNLI